MEEHFLQMMEAMPGPSHQSSDQLLGIQPTGFSTRKWENEEYKNSTINKMLPDRVRIARLPQEVERD